MSLFLLDTEPLAAYRGRRVTVWGLGLFGGGRAVAEHFCALGAEVTVVDKKPREQLEPSVAALAQLPIRWALGGEREEDLFASDLVVVSPAIPRSTPLLMELSRRKVPLETEMNLFFKHCPGRICAVTGSNGKTTTTSLLGAMARQRWPGTRVGGNLGRSLLPEVGVMEPGEWVVLELSSFQLEDLADLKRRPEVSVVTNISPNHLDRHGTFERYVEAKRAIIERGPPPDVAVLNAEDPLTAAWSGQRTQTGLFGALPLVRRHGLGVGLEDPNGAVILVEGGKEEALFRTTDLALLGRFNRMNAAAAALAARLIGVEGHEILRAVRAFQAVEHRLEVVGKVGGIEYLNDSIATTPESTMAALEALGPRVIVVCGGSSKGSSFQELGRALVARARGVVVMGQTASAILEALPADTGGLMTRRASCLHEALEEARAMATPGDRVVLSPACASFDMFRNFEDRGRQFKALVQELSRREPSPDHQGSTSVQDVVTP